MSQSCEATTTSYNSCCTKPKKSMTCNFRTISPTQRTRSMEKKSSKCTSKGQIRPSCGNRTSMLTSNAMTKESAQSFSVSDLARFQCLKCYASSEQTSILSVFQSPSRKCARSNTLSIEAATKFTSSFSIVIQMSWKANINAKCPWQAPL